MSTQDPKCLELVLITLDGRPGGGRIDDVTLLQDGERHAGDGNVGMAGDVGQRALYELAGVLAGDCPQTGVDCPPAEEAGGQGRVSDLQ